MSESNFNSLLKRDPTKKENLIDLDQTKGSGRSVALDVVGDNKYLIVSTGVIASGATGFVFLTDTGEVGGNNPFTRRPHLDVMCDSTAAAGGLARAQGPVGVNEPFKLCTGDFTRELEWIPNSNVYKLSVTNNTGTARDFSVSAEGV